MSRTDTLDLDALQAFVLFGESGSMTQTARRLGVTQSAISQLIKRLERDTGAVLLDREHRPPKLTVAGRSLLELAADLIVHARSVANQVRAGSSTDYAQLKIGCVNSIAATIGPALVQAFSDSAQEIRLRAGLTPNLAEQLASRELDIAICTDVVVVNPRIRQTALFSEGFVMVVPKLAASDMRPSLHELSLRLPMVRYGSRSSTGQQIERYLRHMGVHAPQRFECDSTDPLLSLVAAGHGWTISTPLCLWQSRHFLDELTVIPLPDTELARGDFYLLSRRGESARLDAEIGKVIRQVMEGQIVPTIRQAIGCLPHDAIRYPAA